MRPLSQLLLILICLLSSYSAWADDSAEFLQTAFHTAPNSKFLWLTPALKAQSKTILGHEYPSLRVKYWEDGTRRAWILEEIGKEQPITIGVIIDNGAVDQVRVLVYRESRGGEVQEDFFTRQFHKIRLLADNKLSKKIDGITGATLSVRALQKVVRLALMFDASLNSSAKKSS